MKVARFARRAAVRQARRSATKGLIRRTLLAERLEGRSLLAADVFSYHNQALPTDVDGDGSIAPIDAVLIINSLNALGSRQLPAGGAGEGPQASSTPTYYDVDNDGHISPIDAVLVINVLNAEGLGPNGEVVSYRVVTLEPGTNNPITTVEVGQEYDLQVLVQDLRAPSATNRGLAAAYLDLIYNNKALTRVRVEENQNVTLSRGSVRTGNFTLTLGTETTGPIANANAATTVAANIATALGALPSIGGADNVLVEVLPGSSANTPVFVVRFIGHFDVDFPSITGNASGISGTATISSTEVVKGDPTNANSFTEAFRSRSFPELDAPSAFSADNSVLFAQDHADRINDVGSTAFAATNTDEQELVRARMLATTAGTLTFTASVVGTQVGNSSDGLIRPAHNTVVFANPGESSAVPENLIQVLTPVVTLNITAAALNAVADTATVPEDTAAGVLINVTQNDFKGPSNPPGTIQLRSVGSAGAAGTTSIENGQVRFIPAANFSGTANFTYVIGLSGSTTPTATGQVSVTVTPVNDAPINTIPGPQTITEGASLTLTGANAIRISDADALATDNMTVTLTGNNGNLTLGSTTGLDFTVGDGTADPTMTFQGTIAEVNAALSSLTFTPPTDFPPGATGTASLTIATGDGTLTTTSTVAITVNGVNDAPVVTLPAGPLSVQSVGTLAFTGANAITIADVDSAAAPIRTTIAVTGTGNPGTLTLGSTTGLTFTVGDGTADATMTFTGTQAATDAAIKSLVFNPADIVTVTLTVTTNDQGNSGTGTPNPLQDSEQVIIDVIPPSLPFARSDSRTVQEGSTTPLTIDVLSRVLVNTGEQAILVGITPIAPAGGGTVAINYGLGQDAGNNTNLFDDTVTYTPPGGDVSGTFTFTYTANETDVVGTPGNGPTTGTVAITITPTNDAPNALADSYQGSTDAPLVVTAPGVLQNDTDPEGDAITAVLATGPASGTLTLNPNGGFTYTPSGGGTFSFTYRARDASGLESTPAVVTIAVSAPPTANNDGPFTATEDTPFTSTVSLVANDQDFSVPPTPLTAVLETNVPAEAGTVVINADNTFTYTPAPNFNTSRPPAGQVIQGPFTFTYRASAAGRVSAPATVTLNVTETNDNPTATNDTFQAVKRNGAVGVDQVVPVLGNDSAPDGGETLTVTAVGTATRGTVRLEGGQILYTSPDTIGPDSFTYTISDGRGGTATATVNVTVIDFVPKDLGGTVFLDDDNDGVFDSNESGIGGVKVILTGTDFGGAVIGVNDPQDLEPNVPGITVRTDASGRYNFENLRPGTYTLQEVQPLYLLDGLDTEASALVSKPSGTNDRFVMSWDATDQSGDIVNVNFGERGVDTTQLTDAGGVIRELQGSSQPPEGFWVATDMAGNASWTFTLAGWENCASVSFDLSSDLSSGILTVTHTDGTVYTRTMYQDYRRNTGPLAGTDVRFRVIGTAANGDRIVRIDGTAAQCGLMNFAAATSPAAAAVPGGEGEAAHYAEAADAIYAESAWA